MANSPKRRIRRRGLRYQTGFIEGKSPFSEPKQIKIADICYDYIATAPTHADIVEGFAPGRFAFEEYGYGFSLEYHHNDRYWDLHIVSWPAPKRPQSGDDSDSESGGNEAGKAKKKAMRRNSDMRSTLERNAYCASLRLVRSIFRHEVVRHAQTMILASSTMQFLRELRLPPLTWPRVEALTSPIISFFRDLEEARVQLVFNEARLEPIELHSVMRLPLYTMRHSKQPAFEPLWPITLFGERLEGEYT